MTETRKRVHEFAGSTVGRLALAALFALMLVVLSAPGASYATHCGDGVSDAGTETCPPPPPPTAADDANTAIAAGVDDAMTIVQTNIPLILGVVVAFVALKYGKRLLGKL